MTRSSLLLALGAGSLLLAAPAPALAKSCGSVKGVGKGISVTDVRTTSGSCLAAKTVAKTFARSNGAERSGYTCTSRGTTSAEGVSTYRVTCTREQRKVTFKVRGLASLSGGPPAGSIPQPNAG